MLRAGVQYADKYLPQPIVHWWWHFYESAGVGKGVGAGMREGNIANAQLVIRS